MEPKTRNRVPKLVPVGLMKKNDKSELSCHASERLGGAHNLLAGHLGRSDNGILSVRKRETTNVYYLGRSDNGLRYMLVTGKQSELGERTSSVSERERQLRNRNMKRRLYSRIRVSHVIYVLTHDHMVNTPPAGRRKQEKKKKENKKENLR
jgi:hypothetical protein